MFRFSLFIFGLRLILICIFFVYTPILYAQSWQGIASYYHGKFNGRRTATGEVFSNKNLTAASNKIKLNSWIKVTNLKNNKSVNVRVNDRMNARNKRLIDLTYTAAQELGFIKNGICKVRVEIISKPNTENNNEDILK